MSQNNVFTVELKNGAQLPDIFKTRYSYEAFICASIVLIGFFLRITMYGKQTIPNLYGQQSLIRKDIYYILFTLYAYMWMVVLIERQATLKWDVHFAGETNANVNEPRDSVHTDFVYISSQYTISVVPSSVCCLPFDIRSTAVLSEIEILRRKKRFKFFLYYSWCQSKETA